MKKYNAALIAVSLCLALNAISATVFTNLYSFSALVKTNAAGTYTNLDGANAQAGLTLAGNTLYGATSIGGTNGTGTLFKVNTDGTFFSILHEFSDGGTPLASLLLVTNSLYGVTGNGGTNNSGAIFKINTDGTGFTNLYNFSALLKTNLQGVLTNKDGANPSAELALAGAVLYGTAANGGKNGNGTILRINLDGTGFTNLYNFNAFVSTNQFQEPTNGDGANPFGNLTLVGTTLYGTAQFGGGGGSGSVFAMNTNGLGFTNIYSFSPIIQLTNGDGAYVFGGVVFAGGQLFGTTINGGTNHSGTIFTVSTNGSNFRNLHTFSAMVLGTNVDGVSPHASLTLANGTLYGTALGGGSEGGGTAFSIGTNGVNFQVLYNFNSADGGYFPQSGLASSGNSFYGTTLNDSSGGGGDVFVLSPGSIPLNMQSFGDYNVVTWGNPAFALQSATNVAGPYLAVPAGNSPYTNAAPFKPARFFRLAY